LSRSFADHRREGSGKFAGTAILAKGDKGEFGSVTLTRSPWPWCSTQTSTSNVIEVRPVRLTSV
jgi:hypothetical protein